MGLTPLAVVHTKVAVFAPLPPKCIFGSTALFFACLVSFESPRRARLGKHKKCGPLLCTTGLALSSPLTTSSNPVVQSRAPHFFCFPSRAHRGLSNDTKHAKNGAIEPKIHLGGGGAKTATFVCTTAKGVKVSLN